MQRIDLTQPKPQITSSSIAPGLYSSFSNKGSVTLFNTAERPTESSYFEKANQFLSSFLQVLDKVKNNLLNNSPILMKEKKSSFIKKNRSQKPSYKSSSHLSLRMLAFLGVMVNAAVAQEKNFNFIPTSNYDEVSSKDFISMNSNKGFLNVAAYPPSINYYFSGGQLLDGNTIHSAKYLPTNTAGIKSISDITFNLGRSGDYLCPPKGDPQVVYCGEFYGVQNGTVVLKGASNFQGGMSAITDREFTYQFRSFISTYNRDVLISATKDIIGQPGMLGNEDFCGFYMATWGRNGDYKFGWIIEEKVQGLSPRGCSALYQKFSLKNDYGLDPGAHDFLAGIIGAGVLLVSCIGGGCLSHRATRRRLNESKAEASQEAKPQLVEEAKSIPTVLSDGPVQFQPSSSEQVEPSRTINGDSPAISPSSFLGRGSLFALKEVKVMPSHSSAVLSQPLLEGESATLTR